jgi:dTDP-4-amino-4,6-dideoxygalactose transaminase
VTRSPAELLWRLVPDAPRLRYNAFTGSNTVAEWWRALRDLPGDLQDEGPQRAYEAAFAAQVGCAHAFSFAAGRMALYALLEALELQPGDEVVLPGFSCVVVANALRYRGLHPVFADIDSRTFNLDPERAAERISPRTRALYLQHTFGISADAGRLRGLADRHGLLVIEDACHSLGGRIGARPHGSLGDAAFFSTDRSKVINTHLGGVVTTNDPRLAARLAAIQSATPPLPGALVRRILFTFLVEGICYDPHLLFAGRPVASTLRHLGALFYWLDDNDLERPVRYPYPARFSAPQARLGLSQLAGLEANLAHRRALAGWLEQHLGWYGDTVPIDEQAWLRHAFLVRDRPAFLARLRDRFDVSPWFSPLLHGAVGDLRRFGYQPGSCPVAERVAEQIVNLPTHPRVPLAALERLWQRHGAWIESQILR